MLLLILLIAAVVFGVVGFFTALKWLVIVGLVLLVIALIAAVLDRTRHRV